MAITLVPKYVRALAEQMNAYYRVLKGVDADSVELRLPGGGRFAVHHSGTDAIVFQVTDAGAAGSYAPGDIGTPDIADGAVTSAKILDDTITNADVNSGANIGLGKLSHVGAGNVLRSNGTTNVAGQVVSADIANDTIVDGDIKSDAGILLTKLAHVGAGNVLRSTGAQNVGGPLVAADIPNNSITSAKILDNEIVNGDINAAAGIVYGKLALTNGVVNADINAGAAIAPAKLAAVAAGQILKDVGSGVVGGGLLVDANVAAAGTANLALGKLAPGTSGLLKSNGTAISAGNQVTAGDLPTGGAAIITSAMIVDGTIATADMTANTINGDRLADNSVPLGKLAGSATIGVAKLGEASGTGASAVLEISGITGAYRNLVLTLYGRSTGAGAIQTAGLTFEVTPTAATYYYQRLFGSAAVAGAQESLAGASILVGAFPASGSVASFHGASTIRLGEYAAPGAKPVAIQTAGITTVASGGMFVDVIAGFWTQTPAIDRVRVTLAAGNWTTTSRLTLYGEPS